MRSRYREEEIRSGNNSSVDKRLRRMQLRCALCPPNRGENRVRQPKHGTRKPKTWKDS